MAPTADGKKKKAGMESVNAKLALVMKSGKVLLGYKSTLKSLRSGKGARYAARISPPAVHMRRLRPSCHSNRVWSVPLLPERGESGLMPGCPIGPTPSSGPGYALADHARSVSLAVRRQHVTYV